MPRSQRQVSRTSKQSEEVKNVFATNTGDQEIGEKSENNVKYFDPVNIAYSTKYSTKSGLAMPASDWFSAVQLQPITYSRKSGPVLARFSLVLSNIFLCTQSS